MCLHLVAWISPKVRLIELTQGEVEGHKKQLTGHTKTLNDKAAKAQEEGRNPDRRTRTHLDR